MRGCPDCPPITDGGLEAHPPTLGPQQPHNSRREIGAGGTPFCQPHPITCGPQGGVASYSSFLGLRVFKGQPEQLLTLAGQVRLTFPSGFSFLFPLPQPSQPKKRPSPFSSHFSHLSLPPIPLQLPLLSLTPLPQRGPTPDDQGAAGGQVSFSWKANKGPGEREKIE